MTYNETLNVEIVAERLKEFVSPDYQWPVMPVGWQLEFIVYPDGFVDMDFCHSVSRVFWSESNDFLELPKMIDGSVISVDVLKNAGVPFMTTFGQAKESDLPIEPHLSLVKQRKETKKKNEKVVHKIADEIGGSEVLSTVNDGYTGHCKVVFESGWDKECVVFPSYDEASKASSGAINPNIGGFHGAEISETLDPITHDNAEMWLFGEQ